MSFLIIGSERFALKNGENTLGGNGKHAVSAAALVPLSPFGMIIVTAGRPVTVRALQNDGALTMNGTTLTREPAELTHGARLEFGDLCLIYGELELLEHTSPALPALSGVASTAAPFRSLQRNDATANTGGRVTDLRRHVTYDVPAHGLRIGRDPSSHIVLASRAVSREHALITPSRSAT